MKHGMNSNDGTVPLTSSKLGNLQARTGDRAVSGFKVCRHAEHKEDPANNPRS